MAILKKTLFDESLETINVLVNDTDPNSKYFKITELPDTFTGGKNAFLIQGSPELVSDTIVKIQIRDSQGKIIYHEPGEGIPEYFEGTSKVVAVYIYPDTAFGPCTITILGELSEYSFNGVTIPVPENWKDTYNVKWEKQINVNPILANTSKIRFYRRPKIDITESILPIYNRNVSRLTISGSLNGTPIVPSAGEDYRTFKGVSRYELSLNGLSQFSESMEREIIEITGSGFNKIYSPTITDVTTNKKAFVDVPYYVTGSSLPNYYSVTAFTSASYTMSYDADVTLTDSAINSSFATINITDLDTFSGDVNRIKVYASSKNDLGDFQLLEDVQLESNELLLTSSFANQLNVRTGLFTNAILSSFWTSSAIETGVNLSVDNITLLKSVLLTPQSDYSSSVGLFKFYNKESINFTKNTEYQLDFTPLLSAAADTFGGIEVYMSGSAFTPTSLETNYGKKIGDLTTNTQFRKYDKQQINFKPDADGVGNLVYVVKGGVWHISDISLRAAQESSFSPNEITLTVNVPVKINNETFDFKFELYDINNNYVPVLLEEEFTFTGGNDVDVRRDLQLNVSNNSFNFSTASIFPQLITIDFTKTGLTGSVTFQSQSVDVNGNLITGTPKPGTLDYVDVDTRTLSLPNFTGSSALGVTVGAITYTASCEDVNRYFTIFRIDQGAPARLFYATADKNNFVFDPDDRYKSDIADDYIDIRLVRQNLPSFESEGFNITSGSEVGTPPPLHEIESVGNATVYRLFVTSSTHQYSATPISGSGYVYDFGQSHYDFKYDTVDGDFTSSVTIDAVLKGDKGKGLIATSDANQFFYKMTDLSPIPSSQTITILAKRLNLGSLTNTITVTSGSGVPALSAPNYEGNGVTSYTISAGQSSNYQYSTGVQTYTFTAYDLNGIAYNDEVTLSSVIAESQISVNLTNENATLPARSTGFVASGSFVATSGSVSVKVGGEDIAREENLATNNRFDIISATGTNCTPNDTTPDDATYGITSLTADSGSLSLVVRYKDGRGAETDITKVVTYSKAKAGVPNVVVAVTPSAQTIEANSKGSGSATPNSLTITALEGNTSTFTSLGTPTYTNGLSGTTSTNTLTFTSNASSMSADTGQVTIPVNYTDSEGTTGTKNVVATISKARKAVPSVTISATPQAQTVAANAAGTQTGTLQNVTISALEGTNSMFTSMSFTPANAVGFSTLPTVSGATLTMTSAVMNADEASVTLTVVHTNSEGTTGQTQTITIRASQIKQGESGVVVNLNPASQIVTLSNTGIYGTPSPFTVSVVEGATTYTYSATLASASTFRIVSLSGHQAHTNASITPTTPTTTAGTNVTFTVEYKNAAGTPASVSQSHKVSVTLDGQTGPGVVFTGVWEASRAYQFSTGAGTGRRDVVLWSTDGNAPYEVYYAAIRQHTSAAGNVINGAPHQPLQTGWESLGTQDFFVAAKIGLFEDSYVQSTLNIGTNNNGGISSANITLAGGSTNPYLSIGQATQGYENDGIFLGRQSNVAKFSIVNGTTSFLKWTGTSLEIKGSLNFTNQASVDLSGFGGFTTLSGSVNTAQLVANTATASAATAQSTATSAATAASNAQTAANSAQSSATTAINNLQAVVNGNSTLTGTFINDSFIYSPAIAGNAGYFDEIFRVGPNGITLDGTNKSIYVGSGTYNNANTPFYFKSGSVNVFSLGNKLSFNGSDLTVSGSINATAGNFSGNITSTATISGGTISGGTLNGGSINIGSGKFIVSTDGTMNCTGANINGTVTAEQGNIGGWGINTDGLSFTNTNGTRGVKLNSIRGALEVSTSGSVTVDINSNPFLTDLSAGTTVSTGYSLSITAGTLQGNGTIRYGTTHATGFSLVAGQTYQFTPASAYFNPVTVYSSEYNSIQYGVIISTNPTPTLENSEFYLAGSKYRYGAGSLTGTNVTGNFTATSSGTYYIRPFIQLYSYEQVATGGGFGGYIEYTYDPVDGTMTGNIDFYSVTISRSTQKTEIVGGGIQVVKDIDTFFKVDRNAEGGIGSPFVNSQGSTVLFKGEGTGYGNSFNATNFTTINLTTPSTNMYLGGETDYLGVYTTVGMRLSGGWVRLEPDQGNGLFAYVGNSNQAIYQIKVANGTNPSDERIKTEIEVLENGSIEKIKELTLKKFKYKDTETGEGMGHTKVGVIAQEVQNTSLNGLVLDNSNGIQLEVDYDSLLGHALKAIQELSAKVEKLEAKISGSI